MMEIGKISRVEAECEFTVTFYYLAQILSIRHKGLVLHAGTHGLLLGYMLET